MDEILSRKKAFSKLNANTNFLLPTSFQFSVDRLPFITNFVQTVNFPTQEYTTIEQPTRLVPVKKPGQAISFGNLDISFLLDENMETYMELHSWFRTMKAVDSFDPVDLQNNYSDGILTVLSSAKKPIRRVRFKYLFPVSLSGWEFSSTAASTEPVIISASFAFTSFEIEKI